MLSANPPYAVGLVDGLKKIEWRKKALPIGRDFVYETKKGGGCGMVIGEVWIGGGSFVTADTASDYLIKKGMVDRVSLLLIFHGIKPIFPNGVWAFARYKEPRPLSDFGLKRPPQSWCYCDVKGE